MKVLLVDDDEDDVQLFGEALKEISPHIQYLNARNGKAAIEKLTSHVSEPPDRVFLDINMPVMNGMECLEHIRKSPELSSLKIVIFSTSKFPAEYIRSLELGADYWVKPGSFTTLVEILKNELKLPIV
jgi:CheY-like chemotaxis protein